MKLLVLVVWSLIFLSCCDRIVLGGSDKSKDKKKDKGKKKDKDKDIIKNLPKIMAKDWKPILDLIGKLSENYGSMDEKIKDHQKLIDLLQKQEGGGGSGSAITVQIISYLNATINAHTENIGNLSHKFDELNKEDEALLKIIEELRKELEYYKNIVGKPPSQVPVDRKFTVDADDKVYLYFDGEEIKGSSQVGSWKTSETADLPGTTKVIAVKGINTYGDPGILGSTEDGHIITNSSWRCTKDYSRGWNSIGYDYSSWPEAYEVMEYSEKKVGGINPNANWIWTHNDFKTGKGDRVVFCRLDL